MPLYEYQCNKCETVTNEIQRFNDPKTLSCLGPKCKGTRVRRISRGTFLLKGGGWANDGYSDPS